MRIIYLLLLIVWSLRANITANVIGQSVFVEGNARAPSILMQSSVRSETMISSNLNAKSVESNELVTKKLSAKGSQIDVRTLFQLSFEGRWSYEAQEGGVQPMKE